MLNQSSTCVLYVLVHINLDPLNSVQFLCKFRYTEKLWKCNNFYLNILEDVTYLTLVEVRFKGQPDAWLKAGVTQHLRRAHHLDSFKLIHTYRVDKKCVMVTAVLLSYNSLLYLQNLGKLPLCTLNTSFAHIYVNGWSHADCYTVAFALNFAAAAAVAYWGKSAVSTWDYSCMHMVEVVLPGRQCSLTLNIHFQHLLKKQICMDSALQCCSFIEHSLNIVTLALNSCCVESELYEIDHIWKFPLQV